MTDNDDFLNTSSAAYQSFYSPPAVNPSYGFAGQVPGYQSYNTYQQQHPNHPGQADMFVDSKVLYLWCILANELNDPFVSHQNMLSMLDPNNNIHITAIPTQLLLSIFSLPLEQEDLLPCLPVG